MVNRFDIYLVNLDETVSSDAKNTRPAVVISPDEMNHVLSHVVIAPISTSATPYPTHISIELLGKERAVVLDQMRSIDGARLVKKIGQVDAGHQQEITERLCEFFAK